ncbi:MAG: 4a-hydroxytetrahydrobiopterin dehydratase [Methanobacteriota archaeon]|nr:MAG: 4a-hydroxytetrahydrobiopterin dehydratase [Euryarchaeota archaeon]|tara:strand:- start:3090 stop:3359 length:270 start_codon:yes stop_codon:yes gene_type:complete
MHIFGVEPMEVPTGWSIQENHLMREFSFDNFADAKTFVDEISVICEEKNHHADLHFGWGYVVVELTTHDQGKVTSLDVEVALAINSLEV